MIVLVKEGVETLVPAVDLLALKDLNFRVLAQAVPAANPDRRITLSQMQLIWDAVVNEVFQLRVRMR